MAVITVSGPISGKGYKFQIAGDSPTVDEQKRIDALVSQDEQAFKQAYETKYGSLNYDEGSGIGNYLQEIPKGLARGAVGFGESAGLGLAALLPEKYEAPTREAIRRGAYELSPQADIGLENSNVAQISEGLGSTLPPYLMSLIPVVGVPLTATTALAAGAGQASETARENGATEDQRNVAALKGAAVGALDVIPVFGSFTKFLGPSSANKLVNYLAGVAVQGGEEAAQEATTQVLQNMIEQGYNPDQDLGEGTLASAGIGGLAGAIVQALMPGRHHGGEPPKPAATPAATALATPAAPTTPATNVPPTVAPKAGPTTMTTAPAVDETSLGEALAGIEEAYGVDTNTAMAIYQAIENSPNPNAAIKSIANEHGLTAADITDLHSTLKYEADKTARLSAAGKEAAPTKATKPTKAKKQAQAQADIAAAATQPTLSTVTAPTTVSTAPAPESEKAAAPTEAAPQTGTQATQGTTATAPTPALEERVNAARELAQTEKKASVSFFARRLNIPMADAQEVMSALEAEGTVSPPNAVGKRTLKLRAAPTPTPKVPDAIIDNTITSGTGVGPDSGQPSDAQGNPVAGDNGAGNTPAPNDGAVGGSPASAANADVGASEQPAPVANEAPSAPATFERNAAPGAVSGAAGQIIPNPGIRPVPSTAQIGEAAPVATKTKIDPAAEEAKRVANEDAQRELDAIWNDYVAMRDAKTPGYAAFAKEQSSASMSDDGSVVVENDPTGARDKRQIIGLLAASEKSLAKDPEGRQAKAYFQKYRSPVDAMDAMAYDAFFSGAENQYRAGKDEKGTPEAAFRIGTARKQAAAAMNWVKTNLGPDANEYLAGEARRNQRAFAEAARREKTKRDRVIDARNIAKRRMTAEERAAFDERIAKSVEVDRRSDENIAGFKNDAILKEAAQKPRKVDLTTEIEQTQALVDLVNYKSSRPISLAPLPDWMKALMRDGVVGLNIPLHPDVRIALKSGNMKGALLSLAQTSPSPQVSKVAEKLAAFVGDTKVVVQSGLTNSQGRAVSGAFDPETNTVYIDADSGFNPHTVLHEMTHAATSHVLANPNHPVARQLTVLFENVKGALPKEYGSTSVEEFVSEAMSNPDFQEKLAMLHPSGSEITAFDRFKNIVGNFLRRLMGMSTVDISALDRTMGMVDAILSPAPDGRQAGSLYLAAQNPNTAANVMDVALRNGRTVTREAVDAVSNRLIDAKSDVPRWINKGVMDFTPLHLLVQMAQKHFPSASKLNDLVNNASAALSKMRDMTHVFTEDLNSYIRRAPQAEVDNWNKLTYLSTFYEVDPTLDERAAVKKYGKGGDPDNKLKYYDMVRALYTTGVSEAGRKQFQKSRNIFRVLRQDAVQSIKDSIDALFPGDPKAAERIFGQFYARLTAKGSIDPYFPLARSGDYWLTMTVFDPTSGTTELFTRAYPTERERAAERAELEAEAVQNFMKYRGMTEDAARQTLQTREGVGQDSRDYSNAPPHSFVAALMDRLRKQNVDDKTIRAVTNLVLDTMPETNYAKSFRERKGVLGANPDMAKAIMEKATSMGRQVVQMKYRGQFQRLKTDLTKEFNDNPVTRNNIRARDMLDQLHAVADFAISPTRPQWSRIATNLGFTMTLGFNPSSAMLNFFQLPGIVLPYLGGKYGFNNTRRAMRDARRALTGSGRSREIEVIDEGDMTTADIEAGKGRTSRRIKSGYSISNYDFSNPNMDAETKELEHLVKVGTELGQFNRSQVYDILDLDGTEGIGTKFSAASGFLMHHSERMVREISLAAAYKLEVQRLKAENKGQPLTQEQYEAAARMAVQTTEDTNGGVAAAATPRFAQSGIGSVIFMYKRFAVSMYGLLIKTAHQALKGQSKEARKIAQYQLAGIFGTTGLLSGVAGLPLFGALASVFNMFRDDEEEDFQTLARMYVGDGPYRGLINYLTGVNVATRIGLSDLIFRESLVQKDQSELYNLIEQLGGPVVGTYLNVERGAKLWSDGEYWRGFENMVPAAMRAPLRAFRFATEGAETMDGKAIIEDISPVSIVAQALGFNPAAYQDQLEKNAAKKKFERAIKDRHDKLLDRYFYAYFDGDTATMQEVVQDIAEYNQDYPDKSITGATLQNSLRQRQRTRATAYHGVTFDPKLNERILQFGETH